MLGRSLVLLLSCLLAVSANPTITAAPAAALDARAPSFTGVSISLVSISHVSIDRASITPVSFSLTSLSLHLPSSTCTQTIKPDKNGYVPPGTCGSLYNYYPSFAAAIIFSVLFGAVMVVHIGQAAIYKKKFCWVVIMGAIWEFGSYVSRAFGTRNQQSTGIATVSQLLVLLAPLCMSSHLSLGREILC